jgi:ribonucleoside-triphosphate reductase
MTEPSIRAQVVTRRTYSRPKNEEGTEFETWEEVVDRVIDHQRWLWERAKSNGGPKKKLTKKEESELRELRGQMIERKSSASGRTNWLGGTEIAKVMECSQFNCAGSRTTTIHDMVDSYHLLLNGCGVGHEAIVGVLNGFAKPVEEIEVIRSTLTIEDWEAGKRGFDFNREQLYQEGSKRVWKLTVGDSAAGWAKSLGKLLAMKEPVDKIILDFTQIRASGIRLRGYGWISSGDSQISVAFKAICEILSRKADQLLSRIDILDIHNWIGSTLSSRRAAELSICPYGDPEWEEFALAKLDHFNRGQIQRRQSNNSLIFWQRPSKAELLGIFHLMQMAGGSEPGFFNGEAARKRAPWFSVPNPCGEALLGDKNFCNLFTTDLAKFNGKFNELKRAMYLVGRANYRQTCVDLRDGILQHSWHELNKFLRLCGVDTTGVVCWEHEENDEKWREIAQAARDGAHSMADELGLPRSKLVTLLKPSGTLGKLMDTTEGLHKPLGKYIFNNIGFSIHDPLVPKLRAAKYRVFENPYDPTSALITFPVAYESVKFTTVKTDRGDVEVNIESAVDQLNRYKRIMDNYVDHNASITVSYAPNEVPEIVDWIYNNWDSYVGVSFLYRNDPTKTAADLGYPYLPQEVVTKADYDAYVSQLLPVNLDEAFNTFDEIDAEECSGGMCPVK